MRVMFNSYSTITEEDNITQNHIDPTMFRVNIRCRPQIVASLRNKNE